MSDFRLLANGTDKRLLSDGTSKRLLAAGVAGASFSISPSSGHAVATVPITATGTGTTWTGSNPFTISSGPATISNYANISGTSATFDLNVSAVGGGPIVIADSNSATSQNYDNAAVVPNAPTIGTAVKGNTTASVPYTESSDNGGSAITGHTATSTPGSLTGSGASPITVTGLTNGTSYTFKVLSTNAVGNGPESAASNAVVPSTVPVAPTIGTATPGNTNASVAFTPGGTGGSAITGYTATSTPGSFTGSGASSPVTVTGLSNGTAYTFTVHATNANGNSSESSASNSVTPANTVVIPIPAPYSSSDTIGTKQYDIFDSEGTLIEANVTTGFVDAGNALITNAWGVEVAVVPTEADGSFAGYAVFENINTSEKRAVALNSPPTSDPTDIITCSVAPFTESATASGGGAITAPGYKIKEFGGGSYGARITAGITAITGVTNGFAAKITRTPDANNGTGCWTFWDGG